MKKVNKYQTTELFNNDSQRLNGYENFVALTKDDNLVHTKKQPIPGVIYINQLEPDPEKMITGDVNGEIIQWIRQNSHRVLAKKTGEGTITYIELDDNNSNKYAADGSEAKTDGTEGDVFVKLPTFYYHGTEGDNVELRFSKTPFEDSVEWDTNILIGAYEAYNSGSYLYSRSGIKSSADMQQRHAKLYAQGRGRGYQLVDWQMHCVLGCLFYAMYGNTNSQVICGSGTDSYSKICGETNSLGMNDTASKNSNTISINFWGLENWWGGKSELMQEDGIRKAISTYDPVTKGTRAISIPIYRGFYPKKMIFGKYMDLIPMSDDPKSEDYLVGYCDYQYLDNTKLFHVACRSGSEWNHSCGVSLISTQNKSTDFDTATSSRLAFRGVCTKAESVEAFKSLPVL